MNYVKHYTRLIDNARYRCILPDVCYERHHIIPRCMGGTDDKENLVDLFPEEHYVAHQLLVKMNPDNHSLVYAAHMMGNTRAGNKSYGWLRKEFASVRSKTRHTDETKKKISNSHIDRIYPPMPATTRAAIKAANTGRPSANSGKVMSSESKEKMLINSKSFHDSMRGVPQPTVICPHCQKEGSRITMPRWHFDKCKNQS